MPDSVVVALVFVGIPLVLLVVIRALLKRSAARFGSDGAVAEAFARDDGTFSFAVPSGTTPIGIYIDYSISGTRRSGGGLSYGLVVRIDVERPGFEHRAEYLIGQAQRAFGEVPVAESVDGGPHLRNGLEVRRAFLVARVPAGDALTVSGKVKQTGGDAHTLHVFAKPLS